MNERDTLVTGHCPHCDSSNIRERYTTVFEAKIESWEMAGDGVIAASSTVEEEGDSSLIEYICTDCGAVIDPGELVAKRGRA